MLLGRSGAGKSAAGNAILGREEFVSYPESLTAITQECEKQKTVVEGKRVCSTDVLCYFKTLGSCAFMPVQSVMHPKKSIKGLF